MNMADLLIAVELTPETAEKLRFMSQEGVFAMNTGNIELHFKDNRLLKIITHRVSLSPPTSLKIPT
jgi:hypothetical protein